MQFHKLAKEVEKELKRKRPGDFYKDVCKWLELNYDPDDELGYNDIKYLVLAYQQDRTREYK
ncbi:MAG: hypothetical protein U9N61_10085 [Euryarchaeota archaeon]|nr:hypothetical protein [Euryarchaeota archaeon]